MLLCDDRGQRVAAGSLSSARVVFINRQGRAQVLSEMGPVSVQAAAFMIAGVLVCP